MRLWFKGHYPIIDLNKPSQRRGLMLFSLVGVLAIIMLGGSTYRAVEFMDTPEFCVSCHTVMNPEYQAYQESTHARVDCVNCHIGKGASWLVKSKISGVRQVLAVAMDSYERPIESPVRNLRPARETCEQCHWPSKFSGDRVRVLNRYLDDEKNTEMVHQQVFRIGGTKENGGTGIHWHMSSKVWYVALDERRQEMGWIGVENPDGTLTEYFAPGKEASITPERISKEKRLMDCIDCHNRTSHNFRSPNELVDQALAQGKIDKTIPFIKRRATEVLESTLNYKRPEDIQQHVKQGIETFYATSHPQVLRDKRESIDNAIKQLQRIVEESLYPEMGVTWRTYPNNLGHIESPGCFRCHGTLNTKTSKDESLVISKECTLCHYTLPPSTAKESQPAQGGQPKS